MKYFVSKNLKLFARDLLLVVEDTLCEIKIAGRIHVPIIALYKRLLFEYPLLSR